MHRRKIEEIQLALVVALGFFARLFVGRIPFVDRNHECAPGLENEARQMCILIRHVLRYVEYEHHHVAIFDGLHRLDDRILFRDVFDASPAAHAGGIDQRV